MYNTGITGYVRENAPSNDLDDSQYLASIAEYKDKPYYQYLLRNPWLGSKQGAFSPNLLQKMASWLGDTSAEDNYYNVIRSNREQWLSEALERYRQEEYNSPVQQVARERAAGLNSDLNGNVDSGAAAENDQPILGSPQFGETTGLPEISSFFMNLIPLASGFAKDMMSLQSLSNDVQSGNIDLVNKISSAAFDFISSHVSLRHIRADDGNDRWEIAPLYLHALDKYAKEMFPSLSARKRFKKQVLSTWGSSASKFRQYSSIKSAEDARRAMGESFGLTIGQYGEHSEENVDPIVIVSSGLSKMNYDIQKMQAQYTSDYFDAASGSLAASAENETNTGVVEQQKALSYQRKLDEVVNRSVQSIVSNLESAASGNSWQANLSKALLLLVSAFRTGMLPSLPQVNLKGLVDKRTMIFGDSK